MSFIMRGTYIDQTLKEGRKSKSLNILDTKNIINHSSIDF